MLGVFPVRFPDQLRQHLRALRKARGLTQAQLGVLVGVSQARIAEIEANPGLVNFEQVMKLLSVLGVTLTLHEGAPPPAAESRREFNEPGQKNLHDHVKSQEGPDKAGPERSA